MAATASLRTDIIPNSIDVSQNQFVVDINIVLTGNYGTGASNGDTLALGGLPGVPSDLVPILVEIYEAPPAGTAPNGYIFNYNPGTTINNGVMTIMNNLNQYTPGSAYSGGLLAAVLRARAYFPKFL